MRLTALIAILAAVALTSSARATIYSENFDGITAPPGNFNGSPSGQVTTNHDLVHTANLDEWLKAGAGTIHAVDTNNTWPGPTANPQNWGVMIWQDNVITQRAGIQGSNEAGRTYSIDFLAAGAVYEAAGQVNNGTTDGLRINVLRASDNAVLHSFDHTTAQPIGPGNLGLAPGSFNYVGDGTGDIKLQVAPINANQGRFQGTIDDLTLTDLSLPTVTLLADARADYQATGGGGTTADFNGGEGISDTEGSGRWNYLNGAGGSLLTFGIVGNGGNSGYGGGEVNNLPALGDQQIFSNVSGPAPDEIQMHAGDNADAVLQWTAGADITDLLITGEINHRATLGTQQFDIFVDGVNQFTVDLTALSVAHFNINGLSISAGQHVQFVLSDDGNGTGGDLADLRATISGNLPPAVPEPSTFALTLLGLAFVRRRRRGSIGESR